MSRCCSACANRAHTRPPDHTPRRWALTDRGLRAAGAPVPDRPSQVHVAGGLVAVPVLTRQGLRELAARHRGAPP
jgi:hypothetical protein